MHDGEALAAALEPVFRQNEAQFRRLAEALPAPIYAVDPTGRITFYNEAAAALWGQRPQIGTAWCSSWELYRPDGKPMAPERGPLALALAERRPVHGLETIVERPDGERVAFVPYATPLFDALGNLIGAFSMLVDVSARKRAEEALARRTVEQTALYRFTDELYRTQSRAEIYDAALEAICTALGCERASILLFDSGNVMRFVAWRGLSPAYRAAVEGHSPWAPATKDPHPILVNDVAAAGFADELRAAVQGEGIGALAFIPLVSNRSLIGKFMTYYAQPHEFAEAEIALSVAIARQLAFAIARVSAEEAGAADSRRADRATRWLASIVENSDDAIISKDLDGIVASWNRGAERIFGYSADEMIGKPITVIIPEDRRDEEADLLRRLRNGERIEHFETVRRRRDGTLRDVSLTVSPVVDGDGRVIGASKISRDITDRKRAEAALRDSERRLQELLAAIPAAIYTTDADGRITYANEAAVEFTGRRPRIGIDKWCVSWKLYLPDGTPLPHDQCPMAIALREGRIVRNVEAVAERPDGTRVPFIPYPTPLRDSSGRIVGGINMLVDISERKHSETRQRLLLRELNHRVKNNMQILHVLLHSSLRESTTPEARSILEDACRRAGAMAAAQQVLYGADSATSFSAEEFLHSVCRTAQQTFAGNVTLKVGKAEGRLSNDAAAPLALILNELMTNAVKHGLKGRDGEIRVGLVKDAGAFVLYVEDDGPGFDLQQALRKMSGLGLVQALASQLKGHLAVTRTGCTRCVVRFDDAGNLDALAA
jgi:PAS domain S-box-containing protein